MDGRRTARVIEVSVEHGKAGMVYATSPQMRGLFIAVTNASDAAEIAPLAISEMLLAEGDPSLVLRAQSRDGLLGTWVAIPNAMVEEAWARDA